LRKSACVFLFSTSAFSSHLTSFLSISIPHFHPTSLSFDALASLHSQIVQVGAAAPHARLRREVGALAERYVASAGAAAGGPSSTSSPPPPSVHALAAAAGVPPALLMRRLVEAALPAVGWTGGRAGGGSGAGPPAPPPTPSTSSSASAPAAVAPTPRPTPTAVLRAPGAALLGARCDGAAPAQPHPAAARLAADAAAAAAGDAVFSPRADAGRHAAGAEAEALLRSRLRALGAGHWSEAALRAGGYVCTPDARLGTPFLLGGTPIHWIDSKAAFGSARLHGAQLRDQYGRYVNRYGPGLVIYWAGFDPAILSLGGGGGGGNGGGGSGGGDEQPSTSGLPPRGTVLVRDRLPRPGDPGLVMLRCLALPGRVAGGGG